MSREVTPAAIVLRLAALTAWPGATAPAGVAETANDASLAIAQALSTVRLLEADLRESGENEAEWRERASEAAIRAAIRRAEGSTDEAERLDEVAQLGLQRSQRYRIGGQAARIEIAEQKRLLSALRAGMRALRDRWGRQTVRSAATRGSIRR